MDGALSAAWEAIRLTTSRFRHRKKRTHQMAPRFRLNKKEMKTFKFLREKNLFGRAFFFCLGNGGVLGFGDGDGGHK